jgi:hypothetical protein
MLKRAVLLLAVLCLLVSIPEDVKAQPPSEPAVFGFVADWSVPREKWAEFEAWGEKSVQPVLERMLASGTLIEWGLATRVVHEEGKSTHSTWWVASSIADLEKVREELIKLPPNPAAAGAKHYDILLQSVVYRARTTAATSGYLYVSSVKVKPGMGQAWEALGKKYFHPVLDELLKSGTLLGYGVDTEYVHTDDPAWRSVWYITPSADGEDKVRAAIDAVFEREGATILPALSASTLPSEHRDSFWRVKSYAHK